MAKVNKKAAVSEQVGLPTLGAAMMHQQGDQVPATMQTANGEQAPAALTEGEFVFSIPAIIALGEGDYQAGIMMLEELHQELKGLGESYMSEGMGMEQQPPQQQASQGLGSMPI